jgi:hypothetical protein
MFKCEAAMGLICRTRIWRHPDIDHRGGRELFEALRLLGLALVLSLLQLQLQLLLVLALLLALLHLHLLLVLALLHLQLQSLLQQLLSLRLQQLRLVRYGTGIDRAPYSLLEASRVGCVALGVIRAC